jgi:hypothetical protein
MINHIKSGVALFSSASVLICGLVFLPTNAAFGISECARVKKDVLRIEKSITASLSNFKPFSSKKVSKSIVESYKNFVRIDYVNRLWKIGTNNPQCFSNTQNKYIKGLLKYNYSELIDIQEMRYSKNSKACTDDVYKALYSDECVKTQYFVLTYVKNWKSLYLY